MHGLVVGEGGVFGELIGKSGEAIIAAEDDEGGGGDAVAVIGAVVFLGLGGARAERGGEDVELVPAGLRDAGFERDVGGALVEKIAPVVAHFVALRGGGAEL